MLLETIIAAIGISLIYYGFGEILFLSNVVQFGTDQLCDVPTAYSVYFICAYYCTDNFGQLLTAATNIPGHDIVIREHHNIIAIDTLSGNFNRFDTVCVYWFIKHCALFCMQQEKIQLVYV